MSDLTRTFAIGLARKLYECFSDGRWVSEDIYDIVEDVLTAHAAVQRIQASTEEIPHAYNTMMERARAEAAAATDTPPQLTP